MSFEARYRGYCPNCESAIDIGDDIQYAGEGSFADEVVHVGCVPKVERKTETCTECWLIKPCGCDPASVEVSTEESAK